MRVGRRIGDRLRAPELIGAVAAVVLLGTCVEAAVGGVRPTVVARVATARPVVALTFDDASDPAAMRAILAVLSRHRATATFFPVASAVERSPALWRSIADAGFAVGDHTVSHPDLTTVDDGRVAAEIDDAATIIEVATGRRPTLLRPPFGRTDSRVETIAAHLGIRAVVLWDVASSDWSEHSAATVTSRSLTGTRGSIVLLHAGPAPTIAGLPAIIERYRARGFAFVTVPDLLRDAGE